MNYHFLNATEAADELNRRDPQRRWTPSQVLREAKAGRLPVCFDLAGSLVAHSVDGRLELGGASPRVLDFGGVVRSLTPPNADGLFGFGVLVEIQEVHTVRFSHKDGTRTRGIDLPTEFSYGGPIKAGHKVECWLEDADVPTEAFLFRIDDLAKLVPVTQADPAMSTPVMPDAAHLELVQPAPADDWRDLSLLAEPDELIAVFGKFTGMSKSWFNNITDKPGLAKARQVTGQKGKGGHAPLFCPLAVMQWLTSSKRKVGRPISEEKAWSLLESHFPRVYALHSSADPREV